MLVLLYIGLHTIQEPRLTPAVEVEAKMHRRHGLPGHQRAVKALFHHQPRRQETALRKLDGIMEYREAALGPVRRHRHWMQRWNELPADGNVPATYPFHIAFQSGYQECKICAPLLPATSCIGVVQGACRVARRAP